MRRSATRGRETLSRARRRRKSADGALAEVVVVALPLERGVDVLRIVIGPVGQQQRVLAVGGVALAAAALDDDRAVQPDLFLEARVRVVPVGAGLVHLEAVGERGARRDAVERQPRHAVHVRRQDEAVPVDRGALAQAVSDADGDRVALAHAQQRRRAPGRSPPPRAAQRRCSSPAVRRW